jgi:hypothetical protein
MQFTSYQKRAGAWGLIGAEAAFSLWLPASVLTPFAVAGLHPLGVIFSLLASAVLLVALRRGRAGYLASPLYQG